MTVLLAMLQRKARHIEPQDVAAAVLSQGAAATREELVRLMAEEWQSPTYPYYSGSAVDWTNLCWVCEETARTESNLRCSTYGEKP